MSAFPLLKSCTQHLSERFLNLLPRDAEKKHELKDEVYDLLLRAYADQGGLVGSGFRNPSEMVDRIPFWKINRKHGVINAVGMYKDSAGRKRVAMATDGTIEGKKAAADMMVADLTQGRAYGEASGKSLSFALKQFDLLPYLIPFDQAAKILAQRGDHVTRPLADDPEVIRHPYLKDYFYTREIGGEPHTKVMAGRPNIPLY